MRVGILLVCGVAAASLGAAAAARCRQRPPRRPPSARCLLSLHGRQHRPRTRGPHTSLCQRPSNSKVFAGLQKTPTPTPSSIAALTRGGITPGHPRHSSIPQNAPTRSRPLPPLEVLPLKIPAVIRDVGGNALEITTTAELTKGSSRSSMALPAPSSTFPTGLASRAAGRPRVFVGAAPSKPNSPRGRAPRTKLAALSRSKMPRLSPMSPEPRPRRHQPPSSAASPSPETQRPHRRRPPHPCRPRHRNCLNKTAKSPADLPLASLKIRRKPLPSTSSSSPLPPPSSLKRWHARVLDSTITSAAPSSSNTAEIARALALVAYDLRGTSSNAPSRSN